MTKLDVDEFLSSEEEQANEFYSKYEAKDKLGAGLSSVVRKCVLKETGKEYAVKIIDKLNDCIGADIVAATRDEISVLNSLQGHEHIIQMVDAFETSAFFFLVFELAECGELFDHLTQQVTLSEKKTRKIMYQILQAVVYMHNHGIAHRDMKPENILLDQNLNIRITDFGFAVEIKDGEKLTELCGTPGYMSPEMLRCSMFDDVPGYGKEVDLWACGVIMYTLLVGFPPFWHRRQLVMLRNIMEGKYQFHSPEWDDISDGPKNLISKLLVVEPCKRITAQQALAHPWFEGAQAHEGSHELPHQVPTPTRFCAKWKFKGAVFAIIAIREFVNLSSQGKQTPVTIESCADEPYSLKPVRRLVDGCAFGMYGHWVQRRNDTHQDRAALFQNTPKTDIVQHRHGLGRHFMSSANMYNLNSHRERQTHKLAVKS